MKRKILQKLNWTEDKILKPKYGTANEVRAGQLIDLVLELDLIPAVAATLGVSERTFKRMMVANLPEVRLTGLRTWRYYFIDIIGYRDCKKCFITKPKEEFYNISNGINGKSSYCKACDKLRTKNRQKEQPHLHRTANAKRKAVELNAIPKWADLKEIAKIYSKCPEGYHVDHVIPLQGKTVCGLHVEGNLQYLTVEENLRKGNKWESEE